MEIIMMIVTPILGIAVSYAVVLLRSWVNTNVDAKALERWSGGAEAAAARAYIEMLKSRSVNPTASLERLISRVVSGGADQLMAGYEKTAYHLGATPEEAESRVAGALGELLAADPTISVVAVPVVAPLAEPPVTVLPRMRP